MSDELNRPKVQDETEDEVEAHRGHGPKFNANAEAGDEADDSDDAVEAHRHGPKMN